MPSYPSNPKRYPGTRGAYPVAPKSYPVTVGSYPGAIQLTFLEPTSLAAMVGVNCLVTCRLNRLGTVSLSGLGAATVTAEAGGGYLASYMFTPVSAGSLPITITATDSVNGATSVVPITLTVAAAAVYPATVTPLARFDGAHSAMFQDTAGTTPSVVHGLVKRANDVGGFGSSNWQGPHEIRDPSGIRLEPSNDGVEALPLGYQGNVSSSIDLADSTFVCSWVCRQGDHSLIGAGAPAWGLASAGVAYANSGGSYALPGCAAQPGKRHTEVIRWVGAAAATRLSKAQGIYADLWVDSVLVSSTSVPMSISTGNPSDPSVLVVGGFQSYVDATLVEMSVPNLAVTDAEVAQLVSHADSIPCRPAFPIDQPLIGWTGDSNVVAAGAYYSAARYSTLRALRATYNPQSLCVAVGGSGTPGQAALLTPYYDSRRRRHVAIFEAGTNDIATHSDASVVLPVQIAQMDAARAEGWKVVVATLPDRAGLFQNGADVTYWRAQAAIYRAGLLASVGVHCDAVADLAAIPELAAPSGPYTGADNLTYYAADKVHLTPAGHALMHSTYMAAIEPLLAV